MSENCVIFYRNMYVCMNEFVCVPGVALQRIQVQRNQPLQPDDLLQDPGQDQLPHRLLVTFRLLQGNKLEIEIGMVLRAIAKPPFRNLACEYMYCTGE